MSLNRHNQLAEINECIKIVQKAIPEDENISHFERGFYAVSAISVAILFNAVRWAIESNEIPLSLVNDGGSQEIPVIIREEHKENEIVLNELLAIQLGLIAIIGANWISKEINLARNMKSSSTNANCLTPKDQVRILDACRELGYTIASDTPLVKILYVLQEGKNKLQPSWSETLASWKNTLPSFSLFKSQDNSSGKEEKPEYQGPIGPK